MALHTPVLALLGEPENSLKEHALSDLNARVDKIWPEVADHIELIEELYEDPEFPSRSLAALVAAKVYYNLGDFESCVRFVLAAGDILDLSTSSEFVDTVVAECTRTYIEQRQKLDSANADTAANDKDGIEPRLVAIIENTIKRCVARGEPILALGIALESRRLDIILKIVGEGETESLAQFVVDASVRTLTSRRFRTRLLHSLYDLIANSSETPDHLLLLKIIVQLDSYTMASELLKQALANNTELAYQIAFDFVGTASQELLEKTSATFSESPLQAAARVVYILSGVPSCKYYSAFLQANNHTDPATLTRTKFFIDSRSSIFHSAISFQSALLYAGTTHDKFFRTNMEWLGRASLWTKFIATAALGVIHRGNLTQGRRILQPYLKSSREMSYSKGGALYGMGLVFAGFGKEVLDHLQSVLAELRDSTSQHDDDDVVAHGACLGISLAAMRSGNLDLYYKLREVLYKDSAISGDAAGLAMGLVMLGSKNESAETEMLQYARDTQHERIIRNLALGIALLNYGKEESADGIINVLLNEQDSILRYGGCFAIALAYAGTGSSKALELLLHTAVSDASNDVRRAAVIALGFVLLRNPSSLPRMVELLSESHNPHVRYGTTMALGVACAGTGMPAAVDVLEPMLKDPVDFVRQGAMIALAMILIQQTEQTYPRVKEIREHFLVCLGEKREDAMAKFGAALAEGIIDAGGCNSTISLEHGTTGNLNMKAVAGLAVFLQYWYWFPLAHFISQAFSPTTVVGVTKNLSVVDFKMHCKGPKSLFEYPKHVDLGFTKEPEKVATAILSTTLKSRRRPKPVKQPQQESSDAMEVDAQPGTADQMSVASNVNSVKSSTPASRTLSARVASGKSTDSKKPAKAPSTPSKTTTKEKTPAVEEEAEGQTDGEFEVSNFKRIVPWQTEFVHIDDSQVTVVCPRARLGDVILVRENKGTERLPELLTLEFDLEIAPCPQPFFVPLEDN